MSGLWSDLRSAVRALSKGRLTTALAVLSLALVVAGNTTLFGILNAVLFRPLPFEAPDRLVLLDEREKLQQLETFRASAANFLDWRERSQTFDDMAGFVPARASLGTGETPLPLSAARVTPNFFDVLGVAPLRGRVFEATEGRPGGPRVVLLSHAFAEQQGESELILNDEPYSVIGVLPAGFEFLLPGVQVWLPQELDPALAGTAELARDRRDMMVVGRLRDGVAMADARADLAAISAQLIEEHPEANRGFVVGLVNLRNEYPDTRTRTLFAIMQGVLVFVLLIACANVSNLLLARGEARRGEIAMRTILGAGRGRILRQLMTESFLLAGLGGLLGLLLGKLGIDAAGRSLGHLLPAYWTPEVDARVVTFTFVLVTLAGLFFGLLPAAQSWRTDLAAPLRAMGRGGSSRRLLARSLVVAEIALALMLLCGATMLSRTFLLFRTLDAGYTANPERLLNVELSLPSTYDDGVLQQRLETVVERLEQLPGATRVAVASAPPQSPIVATDAVTFDGHPLAPESTGPHAVWVTASPELPEAVGAAILQGRFLSRSDRADGEAVAVVNRALAEQWPEGFAVGERITVLGTSRRVVGVIGNVRQSLTDLEKISPVVYLPTAQHPVHDVTLLIACDADPMDMMEPLRSALAEVDPRLTLGKAMTQHEFVEQFFAGVHLMNRILGTFGVLAIFLAAVGTYGVLAHMVTQRTREIGVRMALGAVPGQITRMVTRQCLGLALVGLALGAPGALGIVRLISGLFSDLMDIQPVMVTGFAAVLVMVTLVAGYVPARQASLVDPIEALRHD